MKILPVTLLASALVSTVQSADPTLRNWPSWRGPLSSGVAPEANPPVEWDETRNVKWKVAVPGNGNASPIVWEDQVFVLTAVPFGEKTAPSPTPTPAVSTPATSTPTPSTNAPANGGASTNTPGRRRGGNGTGGPGGGGGGGGGRAQVEQPDQSHRFTVIAYDRATGKVRWQDTPTSELPHEGHHKDHGYASSSPVTDGEVLIAYFGSRGLHAYDLQGRKLWSKNFGRQSTRNSFGEGSSPALHGNTVIVVWDHEGEDFIVALDKKTGKELWRKPREESTNWSTPLIVQHGDSVQAVVNSGNKVRAYDVSNGETIWEASGQTQNAIPAPVPGHGRVYVTSGWRGAALQAITLGKKGDLTGTDAIAWSHAKNTPYVPSPLLYGDYLYFYSNNNAQLSVFNAREGKQEIDAERLDGLFGVYASPTGAADRVYLTGRNGAVWVIRNGPKLDILAKNRLDDAFDATPAIAGNELFLRGKQNLYALADSSAKTR